MEKLVRVKAQQPLRQTQWTSGQGEKRVINSVELTLTDGVDTFVAELQGEEAINCPHLDPNCIYAVQCRLSVREWQSQQSGQTMRATSIRIVKLCAV